MKKPKEAIYIGLENFYGAVICWKDGDKYYMGIEDWEAFHSIEIEFVVFYNLTKNKEIKPVI